MTYISLFLMLATRVGGGECPLGTHISFSHTEALKELQKWRAENPSDIPELWPGHDGRRAGLLLGCPNAQAFWALPLLLMLRA